jgi:hypothetical protein
MLLWKDAALWEDNVYTQRRIWIQAEVRASKQERSFINLRERTEDLNWRR